MVDVRDRRNLELVGELVETYFPDEFDTFKRMQRLEASIDEELLRRQLALKEVQALVENKIQPLMNQRRFRVHVFHTHDNQGSEGQRWAYVPRDLSRQTMTPSWTLRIQGALLNTRGLYVKQHFSDFFDKVMITTPEEVVVWSKASQTTPCDGIELKRSSEKEMNVEIVFFIDKARTELLDLPAELAGIVGSQICTIPVFYRALCQHIKSNSLLVPEDPSLFMVDAFIGNLFEIQLGSRQPLSILVQVMRSKFKSNGVVSIKHVISFDSNESISNEQVFDFAVEAVDPRTVAESLPQSAEFQQISRTIAELDKDISEKGSALKASLAREAFFNDFVENPKSVIDALIAGGAPKLEQVVGTTLGGGRVSWLDYVKDVKKGGYYQLPWAVSAAQNFVELAKKEALANPKL